MLERRFQVTYTFHQLLEIAWLSKFAFIYQQLWPRRNHCRCVEEHQQADEAALIGGTGEMRSIGAAVVCVALSGGWASAQNAAPSTQAGNQFVGKDVHVIADKFGLPTGRKKMDNDEMLYVWELGPVDPSARRRRTTDGWGGRYDDGETPGYMTDDPRICRLTVIASVEGIVTQVTAEDENGTGAPKRTFGLIGSVCADRGLAR